MSQTKDSQMESTLQWGSHMSTISPLLPTQAGQTQMPAGGALFPGSFPTVQSLSHITGMSVVQDRKEIDVGFAIHPHHLQNLSVGLFPVSYISA